MEYALTQLLTAVALLLTSAGKYSLSLPRGETFSVDWAGLLPAENLKCGSRRGLPVRESRYDPWQ